MIFNDKLEYSLKSSSDHEDHPNKPIAGIDIQAPAGAQLCGIGNHIGTHEPIGGDPIYSEKHIGYGRYRIAIGGWGYVDVDFSDADCPGPYGPQFGLDSDIWLRLDPGQPGAPDKLYWYRGNESYQLTANQDLIEIWDQSRVTEPDKHRTQNRNGFKIPSEYASESNIPPGNHLNQQKIFINAEVQSDITIIDDIEVESGAALEFETPGVQALFNSGKKLIINGQLNVSGTSGSPVLFSRSGSSD